MTERISSFWLNRLLGIPTATPLDPASMSARLRVAICPAPELSERLQAFTTALREAFRQCGVTMVDAAPENGRPSRFEAGTAVIAPGSFPDKLLPINRVSTLYNNLIVGVYDEPPPVRDGQTPQEALDAVIGRLAWEMVHLLIYVTDETWTVCSMNGGITTFRTPLPEARDVLESLIPKITAQVVPPRDGDLELRDGALKTATPEFRQIAADFVACGRRWAANPRFMNHTSRGSLDYRNDFYRKIVSRYLDDRSGMSYGFFARQLPVAGKPALEANDTDEVEKNLVPVTVAGKRLLVPVPDVRILTTRSGCRKTAIDPERDLVQIGLDTASKPWIATPEGLPEDFVTRPSFDTLTIIAHAVGNTMIASILRTLRPDSRFPKLLERFGSGMTHWHHYPDDDMIPKGYIKHGKENPPVSCSTPQSAAYSLLGKLEA
ncbi:MAG TPA: hypothetical protein ENL07_03970, partial [Chlorobaculum parvum]|nr:hypothetical protein [Chlorobaculum parvum]